MISHRLRNVLRVFSLAVIIAGPVFGFLVLAYGFAIDQSGQAFGRSILNVSPMMFSSVFFGGILRLLISIDSRLEQKG